MFVIKHLRSTILTFLEPTSIWKLKIGHESKHRRSVFPIKIYTKTNEKNYHIFFDIRRRLSTADANSIPTLEFAHFCMAYDTWEKIPKSRTVSNRDQIVVYWNNRLRKVRYFLYTQQKTFSAPKLSIKIIWTFWYLFETIIQ